MSRDIVLWNCDENTDDIVIQSVHKTICSDIQVVSTDAEFALFLRLISRTLILSSGYDQLVHLTNLNGEALKSWQITPLPTSLPGVNPPYVTRLACNPQDGRQYCGAMDGSVRFLTTLNDSPVAQPVITTHNAGISDVLL